MKTKKKITLMLIIIIVTQVLMPILSIIWKSEFTIYSMAVDAEGETEYYINTAQDLWEFAEKANNGDNFGGKVVYLNSDINLNCDENNQWVSIKEFRGTFDGKGHTISRLVIKDNKVNRGLFLTNSGCIKGLNLDRASINLNETTRSVGAICAENNGKIINCNVTNSEIIYTGTSGIYVGGICGYNSSVRRCN